MVSLKNHKKDFIEGTILNKKISLAYENFEKTQIKEKL